MPFVQRVVEPKYLSRTSLSDGDGKPLVTDEELEAVTNSTLSNALRQLASIVLIADDIFAELREQLGNITERSECLKTKIGKVEERLASYDPKKVSVPEGDLATLSKKTHFAWTTGCETNLFNPTTRPKTVRDLYDAAAKTPVAAMRQMDRWRRDGHRSSRFFMCTPVLGARRKRIRANVDIDIETRMPAVVEDLRRWTSTEALGDVTVGTDGPTRILSSTTYTDGNVTDGTIASDDEGLDHKLPSPEEQLQVVALKFPAEMVAVDVTGKSFDRMCAQRRSMLQVGNQTDDGTALRRRRSRKPRGRRRNTLAGTDQKEIRDALIAGDDPSTAIPIDEPESPIITGAVSRSKSSDLLRKKDSPENKKSHFNTLKQWGKNRLKMMASKSSENNIKDIDDINIYETVTVRRKRNVDKDRKVTHERKPSCSSSEKSSFDVNSVNAVRLRDSSVQRRLRRSGENKDEPHSSSGNWSASSESGRASIGSEITNQPKSTTSAATSNNSLNLHPPNSVNSRRRFVNTSGSATSEGTLTPDIIHDLHDDGETSSVYSCDTEGYYTSFHMDSGLKTLKEEDSPVTPLHSSSTFSNSGSNNTILNAENEYELFGKGSTSTTTSSAGTVCTTLRAASSNRSLILGPTVPERKSSLSKSPESSLERDYGSEKTGTVKRSPATTKATVIAVIHKTTDGDVSPDSGHNTSSSPIESINSPNGVRSGSEFDFSESDMEGSDRIERIRLKTAINSSRIPSMCVITPTNSDDESVKSHTFEMNLDNMGSKNETKSKLDLPINPLENNNNHVKVPVQLINVNPQTGYATIENQVSEMSEGVKKGSHRAASPSGGSVTVKQPTPTKSPQLQPIFKATLMPLNSMLGRLKLNFNNLRRDSKSPVKQDEVDSGDYVTISDVRNNNEKSNIYANDVVNRNLKTVLSGQIRDEEYISLNELPCNENADSLERKRKGARVTLDSDGKVVYSSDSLRRRKGGHTSTFEPGPFVKQQTTPNQSPVPTHRTPKTIRPVTQQQSMVDQSRPLSPQLGKVVIKASTGMTSPTAEIIRMPPSTIVSPMSPKPNTGTRGAYVHMQESPHEGRAVSPSSHRNYGMSPELEFRPQQRNVYGYQNPVLEAEIVSREFERRCGLQKGAPMYATMPNRRVRYQMDSERSVTPDITRKPYFSNQPLHQNLGIPVQVPKVSYDRISPIDPRNVGGFHSSTPSKVSDLKGAVNLDSLLSPKKSTMSNEELYAAIHKSKKKMNIQNEDFKESPNLSPVLEKKPIKIETGYLSPKSRMSWSPNDYVDFEAPNEIRSRGSWACPEKKESQTSRLDFKRLLLMHGRTKKKISAVEQLKPKPKENVPILDLTSSPRNLKKLNPGSPVREKPRPPPKILSPRSQWRFANPRSDVLSSTILEDCHEDESPNTSGETKSSNIEEIKQIFEPKTMTATQRLQAQRAQFFKPTNTTTKPTLETSF